MKNILIFIFALTLGAFTCEISAQVNKTITTDVSYALKGGAGDTVKLAGAAITYTWYVKDWCNEFQLGVESDSVRAAQHSQTIIASSLDNVNYTNLDTVTIDVNGNNKWGISDFLLPNKPYIKLTTTQVTEAGTTRVKYFVIIGKN
jgi:hypothetical protein